MSLERKIFRERNLTSMMLHLFRNEIGCRQSKTISFFIHQCSMLNVTFQKFLCVKFFVITDFNIGECHSLNTMTLCHAKSSPSRKPYWGSWSKEHDKRVRKQYCLQTPSVSLLVNVEFLICTNLFYTTMNLIIFPKPNNIPTSWI
jgi:hypothetical protein